MKKIFIARTITGFIGRKETEEMTRSFLILASEVKFPKASNHYNYHFTND